MTDEFVQGDYVLATKFGDGHPQEQWAVGFYGSFHQAKERHIVLNEAGEEIYHNGFRRCAKISRELGAWLLKNASELERAPVGSISLWGMTAPYFDSED